MCGIWGSVQGARRYSGSLATVKNTDFAKFAYSAAIAGTLRGADSTGIALVGRDGGDAIICKAPVPGGVFVTLKDAMEAISLAAESNVVIGHNRAATLGTIDEDTAHPFQHGDITMVHNGTVHDYRKDLGDLITAYAPVNDSDAIAYALNVAGWKEVLPRLTGAYALAWWDKSEDKFFLARNSERPMHIAFADYANEMYYASEEGMLRWLCEREKNINRNTDVFNIAPGFVYGFEVGEGRLERTFTKEEFTIAKKSTPWTGHFRGWGHGSPISTTRNSGAASTTTKPRNSSCERLLDEIGVKRGEVLGFLPETIKFNKEHSKHGQVVGELVKLVGTGEMSTTKGYIHGIDSITWAQWKAEGWLEVKVQGVLKDKSAVICTFHGYAKASTLTEGDKSAEEPREYRNGHGSIITEQEFLELAKGGCVACHAAILAQDADSVEFVGLQKNHIICAVCADQDWNKG